MEHIKCNIGDVVRLKKKHPCGSDLWTVSRTGMDFGLICKGCEHFVMLPRTKLEKMLKAIVERAPSAEEQSPAP